ncbi:MAG: hypothetical protein V8Q36_07260 [Anaerotignum sp.]
MYGQFFILFGLILVGYYCNKKGYLPMETNKNVGGLVMRVTIPAMLITTIASIEITDRVLGHFFFCRRAGSHDDSVWLFDAAIRAEKRAWIAAFCPCLT